MQIVETVVKVTVEMVLEVVTKVELPEVTVLVTGHVVTVSQVTTVVVASPGAGVVPAGDEGAREEATEVTPGAEEVPTRVETAEVPLRVVDPAGELTGKTPLGLVPVGESVVEPTSVAVVSVTGHTVVEIGIVEVTTVVESAGQLTTSGAQLVMVTSLVVYTVEVVIWTGVVINGVEAVEVPAGELIGKTPLGLVPVGRGVEPTSVVVVSVTGHTVVEIGIVEVTTVVESAGQLTTSGAQLVMVTSLVVYTVEVVIWTGVVINGVEAAEVPPGVLVVTDKVEEAETEDKGTGVPLEGGTPADELTGRTPLGPGITETEVELVASTVVSVTGHTVVEIGIVEVTTVVESAGQLTTSGAQLVIVTSLVVYTVEVVIWTGVVINGVEKAEVPAGVVEEIEEEAETEDVGTDVSLEGGTPADELTGRTPVGLVTTGTDDELVATVVASTTGLVSTTGVVSPAGSVSVTGQTVVDRAMVEVTTVVEPDPAGQSVTDGAQLVMVIKLVVNTVDVVIRRGVLTAEVVVGTTSEPGTETEGTTEPAPTDTDICSYGALTARTGVAMTGAVVVEPGVQSKPTL